jgi:hypothetical protein
MSIEGNAYRQSLLPCSHKSPGTGGICLSHQTFGNEEVCPSAILPNPEQRSGLTNGVVNKKPNPEGNL